jgi:hypothetical protein
LGSVIFATSVAAGSHEVTNRHPAASAIKVRDLMIKIHPASRGASKRLSISVRQKLAAKADLLIGKPELVTKPDPSTKSSPFSAGSAAT